MQRIAHSALTFSMPRSRNCRKPLACLTKDRLDDLLAQSVTAASSCPLQLLPHGLGQGPAEVPFDACRVLGASSCEIGGDAPSSQAGQIGFAAVTGVGRGFFGPPAKMVGGGLDQWQELIVVTHTRRQLMRHDDLRLSINGGLGIVSWM